MSKVRVFMGSVAVVLVGFMSGANAEVSPAAVQVRNVFSNSGLTRAQRVERVSNVFRSVAQSDNELAQAVAVVIDAPPQAAAQFLVAEVAIVPVELAQKVVAIACVEKPSMTPTLQQAIGASANLATDVKVAVSDVTTHPADFCNESAVQLGVVEVVHAEFVYDLVHEAIEDSASLTTEQAPTYQR